MRTTCLRRGRIGGGTGCRHQRIEQVASLDRPRGFQQQPRDQLDGTVRRLHSAEKSAVANAEPIEELVLLVGIVRVPGQAEDQHAQRRTARDGAQDLDPAGRLMLPTALAARGQGQLALHAVKSPDRRRMLGVDAPSCLERRPPQDQADPASAEPSPGRSSHRLPIDQDRELERNRTLRRTELRVSPPTPGFVALRAQQSSASPGPIEPAGCPCWKGSLSLIHSKLVPPATNRKRAPPRTQSRD